MSTHTEITWAMAAEEAAVVVHIEKKSIFDYKFHAILWWKLARANMYTIAVTYNS